MPEWEWHCQPTSVLPATHVIVSWNREDAERAKYKSNNLGGVSCDCCDCDTELKLVCIGWRGSALLLTGHLFSASRAASTDCPKDNYHCFASFSNGRRVGLCAFVQLLLWIRSVPVRNAYVRRATAWPRNVTSVGVQSPLLGLLNYLFPFRNTRLSMYWGSRHEQH